MINDSPVEACFLKCDIMKYIINWYNANFYPTVSSFLDLIIIEPITKTIKIRKAIPP